MPKFVTATAADAQAIAALEAAYIECPWTERMVCDTLAADGNALFLLVEDGALLGYGGVRTIYETAEVYNIVVDAPYRRRGYGRQILRKLIDFAKERGCGEMLLEVAVANRAAIDLYEGDGFTVLSVRKKYYASGDALVMRKVLA